MGKENLARGSLARAQEHVRAKAQPMAKPRARARARAKAVERKKERQAKRMEAKAKAMEIGRGHFKPVDHQ